MQLLSRTTAVEVSAGRTGSRHLEECSVLRKQIGTLPKIRSVLIVEDTLRDAEFLASSLRLALGADIRVTHVADLRALGKALAGPPPDLLFLDDRLGPVTTAEASLTVIHAAGYHRPVVVMSGLLTRSRHNELLRLGVADVIHKDDRNTARLSEAILRVFAKAATDIPPSRLA